MTTDIKGGGSRYILKATDVKGSWVHRPNKWPRLLALLAVAPEFVSLGLKLAKAF